MTAIHLQSASFPKNIERLSSILAPIREGMEEKTAASGLTPKTIGESVTYEEANLAFLCKKLYQNQFSKENLHCDIRQYYASFPEMFPDFNGGWQPHIVFMGEIVEVEDRR